MGVPRLFGYVTKMFKAGLNHFKEGDYTMAVDHLLFDANALLHSSAQDVFNYGANKKVSDPYSHLPYDRKRLTCYQKFFDDIKSRSTVVVPQRSLYIAIDGPAPLAKQAQQRQRRFAAAQERKKDPKGNVIGFDSNQLTPGTLFMFELTKFMHTAIRKELNDPLSQWHGLKVYFSPPTVCGEGEHKCYSPDTKVFMWSGEIKEIKDIKVGEYVVSENGKPRKVISRVSGTSKMFLIEQKNGDSYTVTEDHIMCFDVADHCRKYYSEKQKAWMIGYFDRETNTYKRKQFSGNKKIAESLCDKFLSNIDHNSKIDVKLSVYNKMSRRTQKLMYGYKCTGIQWPEQEVDLDPYILGSWLGDGYSSGQGFASIDSEIIKAWEDYAKIIDCQVKQCIGQNKVSFNVSGKPGRKKGCNYFLSFLQKSNLIDNKHIPDVYMRNSREIRLQLLAGLIDTDGNLTHEGRMIRFNQGPVNFGLFDQVVILARSLGFKCCVREAETTYTWKDEKRHSTAKFLTISGHIEDIPTKLPRKKCVPLDAEINIDRLRTSITVTPVKGVGKYVGINVTGSRRFLLADLTVGHNCLDYIRANPRAMEESYCMFGPDGDLIMLTLAAHVPNMYLFRDDQFNPGFMDILDMGFVRRKLQDALQQSPGVSSRKRTTNDITNDFIVLGFFVGNDFLPKIQMFMYLEDGLELMISTHARVTKGGTQNSLTKNGVLQHQGFTRFVQELARREHSYILDQATPKPDRGGRYLDPKFDNHTLLKNIRETNVPVFPVQGGMVMNFNNHPECTIHAQGTFFNETKVESGPGKKILDMEGYRRDYYSKSGIADFEPGIRQICLDYLRAIAWVFKYYIVGLPSWRDFYAWHYAPLMTDLAQVMSDATEDEIKYIYDFEMDSPPRPFVQLLSVLPPPSADLLPVAFRSILTSPESPLVKLGYYPDTFEVDLEGKTKEHMGVVLLPFVDVEDIEKEYRIVVDSLEKQGHTIPSRNNVTKPELFVYDKNFLVCYKSDYGNIERCHVRKSFI